MTKEQFDTLVERIRSHTIDYSMLDDDETSSVGFNNGLEVALFEVGKLFGSQAEPICTCPTLPLNADGSQPSWPGCAVHRATAEPKADVVRLHPPNSQLSRVSEALHGLIDEMHKAGLETLLSACGGFTVNVKPENRQTEPKADPPSRYCQRCGRTAHDGVCPENRPAEPT